MTREEAIKRLSEYAQYSYGIWHNDEEDTKAFEIAIEALSADRPMGEWINQDNGAFYPYECSNCHEQPFCDDYGYHLTNYCPNCGARMKGGDAE